MKNYHFLLVFLLLAAGNSNAQAKLDSLYTVWQDKTLPDSTRVDAYKYYIWNGFIRSQPDTAFVLAEALKTYKDDYPLAKALGLYIQGISWHFRSNYPLALDYLSQSLRLYEKIGDQRGVANSLNSIGRVHEAQGNYPKALDYYNSSLTIWEQLGMPDMAIPLNNIGNIFYMQGDYPNALKFYNKSLKIKEQQADKHGMASSLNNIGNIYALQENYPTALDYFTESLTIKEQLGDKRGMASSLNNIGNIYLSQKDFPKAIGHFGRSLKINEQLGDQVGIAYCLNSIGNVYFKQGDEDKALDHFTQSLHISEQLGDQKGMANYLNNIGKTLAKKGIHTQALKQCERGYELAVSIGTLEEQRNACNCLYEAYKAMGNGNKALVYHELLNAIEDSMKAEETSRKLQQMEFKEVMLKDSIAKAEEARLIDEAHQEEVRQKNRTRNILSGVGFFALLLAGGFFWRWRYVHQSKAVLQVEKDRSENLLLNILPADIAAELKEKGRADARDFEKVSILFTDFKGFTAASEKLSAQELVSEINTCFEAFDGIMGKYNIEKIKTIGDAYMAAGGLPVPTDDSVKNTVLAALEMQDFIRNRKAKLDAEGKPAFEMRVGVHTGPVVAGIVGIKKFQYDIWGDTVNTASRMESSGEIGKVNISEETYELLKDDSQFSFESRGKIAAKGKGEMEMFFVSQNS